MLMASSIIIALAHRLYDQNLNLWLEAGQQCPTITCASEPASRIHAPALSSAVTSKQVAGEVAGAAAVVQRMTSRTFRQ